MVGTLARILRRKPPTTRRVVALLQGAAPVISSATAFQRFMGMLGNGLGM